MSQAFPSAASPSFSQRLLRVYDRVGFLPVILIALVDVLALLVPRFLSLQNVFNVLRSSSYLVIISAGQIIVLVVGVFVLFVVAVGPLASVVSALTMVLASVVAAGQTAPVVLLGVLAGLLSGLAVGLLNGLSVAFLRVSPFIVTLGSMSIATGVALLLTNGIPVYGMPKAYVDGSAAASGWTSHGRLSRRAGRGACLVHAELHRDGSLSLRDWRQSSRGHGLGVRTKTYLVLAYAACSILAAVSGLALTAQIGSGQAVIGAQLTLESIAAAVIAGVAKAASAGWRW
jgi:ribose transport system permease protein